MLEAMQIQNDVGDDLTDAIMEGLWHYDSMLMQSMLGLQEECGEVARLVKFKLFRPDRGEATVEALKDELGDVLWYVVACMTALELDIADVWNCNRKKMEDRYGSAK